MDQIDQMSAAKYQSFLKEQLFGFPSSQFKTYPIYTKPYFIFAYLFGVLSLNPTLWALGGGFLLWCVGHHLVSHTVDPSLLFEHLWVRRLHYISCGLHRHHPRDPDFALRPWPFSLGLLVATSLCLWILGLFSLFAGFLFGFCTYEWTHFTIHQTNSIPFRLFEIFKIQHLQSHQSRTLVTPVDFAREIVIRFTTHQ